MTLWISNVGQLLENRTLTANVAKMSISRNVVANVMYANSPEKMLVIVGTGLTSAYYPRPSRIATI